jgi:FkbM family methyltransferase
MGWQIVGMNNRLKSIAQKFLKLFYIVVDPRLLTLRNKKGNIDTFLLLNQPWLKKLEISTVLDIGSNIGQFAISFNSAMPKAKIFSFEPIPECFRELQKNIENIPNITAFNIGLGDFSGDLEFEENEHTMSSSFLKMTSLHKQAFPHTTSSKLTKVKVEKLDSFAEKIIINRPLLIKLDVQGYEEQVIKGGENIISQAAIIIVETSFTTLYEEQPLFKDIYDLLKKRGFSYAGSFEDLRDPTSGEILQEDSIFLNITNL